MSWTQTDIDRLKAAIASGARRVKIGDEETEFRDLDEMQRTLSQMSQSVHGHASRPSAYFARFGTGK
jgi:hypothetical protein